MIYKIKRIYMKNYLLLIACCLLIVTSCKQSNNNAKITASKDLYTCSMHPQILEHHSGVCPVCGMKLVKKNIVPVTLNDVELKTLLEPTNEFIVASLPVTTPQQSNINIPVKAYGTIESDTRAAGSISTNVSGRIEKLYLRYRYQKIEAGQKVMEIYSPELVTAQEN